MITPSTPTKGGADIQVQADEEIGSAPSLRSGHWFGLEGKSGFLHRSWLRGEGLPPEVFDGRPVIGICNSWSELTPCNVHLRTVAEAVKRGVWQAGGLPLEFPTISIGETLMRPSALLFRNLMSMDVEETLRSNPIDGVILLAGCDKTTPAQLMGAASVDLPTIMITGGPKLNGKFRGQDIGSGTDVWRLSEEVRAGVLSLEALASAEICMSRSDGHCMTMGTASTMACLVESMGMQLSGTAAIPAVDSRRLIEATRAGKRIVELVQEDTRISSILTREALENAIKVNAAIGGSTNAIIHLLALAGRVGVELELADVDRVARDIPLLVNLMPSGEYLMEDFFYAGGLPAVMNELMDHLHLDVQTVDGETLGQLIANAECFDRSVVASVEEPILPPGKGTAVLFGNLCPNGAVIKQSAASAHLLRHEGPALVFDSLEDYNASIDNPHLPVSADTVLVVRNAGPKGYPGMPEIGNLALPKRMLEQGVDDMVRISDARMSGTSYGTVVLHVAPEAAFGGPLALIRNGDLIRLDVESRSLEVVLADSDLDARRAAWQPPVRHADRGYVSLYLDHVLQADQGADFDFLVGASGADIPRLGF